MENGYYLCKVCIYRGLHKHSYEARILYWDNSKNKWLDKEDSFFVTNNTDVICSIRIPDTYYETITV